MLMMNEEQSYQFWPRPRLIVFNLLAGLFGWLIAVDLDPARASIPPAFVWTAKVLLVGVPVFAFLWLISVRLKLDAAGVSYRSIVGNWSMRWDEVDEIYCGIRETLLYGVLPLGKRYHFTLKSGLALVQRESSARRFLGITFESTKTTKSANSHSFGSRFGGGEKLYELLNKFTFPLLSDRATRKLNQGSVAEFGGIGISTEGLTLSLFADLFGFANKSKPVPWADVDSYSLKEGVFRVNGRGQQLARVTSSGIPNLLVMMSLLERARPTFSSQADRSRGL